MFQIRMRDKAFTTILILSLSTWLGTDKLERQERLVFMPTHHYLQGNLPCRLLDEGTRQLNIKFTYASPCQILSDIKIKDQKNILITSSESVT